MFEITVFLGTAKASHNNPQRYKVGEEHPILLFLRQEKGSAHDWSRASNLFEEKGWFNVSLAKASPVATEELTSVHSQAVAAYKDAVEEGFAAVVFDEPVT